MDKIKHFFVIRAPFYYIIAFQKMENSMTETNQTLEKNLTHTNINGRDIYLLGTAHVSKKSVEDVKEAVSEIKPEAICVELLLRTKAEKVRVWNMDNESTVVESTGVDGPYRRFVLPTIPPWEIRLIATE